MAAGEDAGGGDAGSNAGAVSDPGCARPASMITARSAASARALAADLAVIMDAGRAQPGSDTAPALEPASPPPASSPAAMLGQGARSLTVTGRGFRFSLLPYD